jgi:hypothetical protein
MGNLIKKENSNIISTGFVPAFIRFYLNFILHIDAECTELVSKRTGSMFCTEMQFRKRPGEEEHMKMERWLYFHT